MRDSRTYLTNKRIRSYCRTGEPLHFVNIICPGYQKDRTIGIEDFSFQSLSCDIQECPNVLSMVDKLATYTRNIERILPRLPFQVTTIFADTAILNYDYLSKKQNVRETLDKFALTAKKYVASQHDYPVQFLQMSYMKGYFQKLPIEGYAVKKDISKAFTIRKSIQQKAQVYVQELVEARSQDSHFLNKTKKELIQQTEKEVYRFVYEYGFAGKEIYQSYPQAIMTFTEPSGIMRGYFYNAFLFEKDYIPVIYLP